MLFALPLLFAGALHLDTEATRSNYTRTGRLDEVADLCTAVTATTRVTCNVVGTSPEGRAIFAFRFGAQASTPTVLIIGGIHAGEIDGKDASLRVMADLLNGTIKSDDVNLVFVPVYNVDGHERIGKNHRPNQRGPEETGWRVTSSNLNLNRDWAKADAPETRALLALIDEIDPEVTIDLHVTDGAQFQHDIAVIVEPAADDGTNTALVAAGRSLSTALQSSLKATKHLPLDFYPAFEVDDDPGSGIAVGVTSARFTHGYAAKRGRIGVLVETHSWRPYRERVFAMVDLLKGFLQTAKTQSSSWTKAAAAADATALTLPGKPLTLKFETDLTTKTTFDFRGYAYTRTPSTLSGALWTRYDETKKQTWKMPLWRTLKPAVTTTAPAAYAVLPGYAADVVERLQAHHIAYSIVTADQQVHADRFKADDVVFGTRPYEARMTAKTKGSWTKVTATTTLPKGTVIVPVAQKRARLVLELFEPGANESFVGWGFFNACFEQKEYMEAYVVEVEARAMLAQDPALEKIFNDKVAADAAFAKDSAARLDFFYERHPAWDDQKNVVPVLRLSTLPSSAASSSSSQLN